MSDKFVKAFWGVSTSPDEESGLVLPRGSGWLKGSAKALTFSPSIIS